MESTAPALTAEVAREAVRQLGLHLKEATRASGRSSKEISRRLGKSPHFLSRIYRGELRLRIETLFSVLGALEIPPSQFFGRFYPLGGWAPEGRFGFAPDDPLAPLTLRLEREQLAKPPQQWAREAGRILIAKIVGAGRKQTDLSVRLGLNREVLGRALRGNSRIEMFHVFGVLHEIGLSPARFFAELIGQEPDAKAPSTTAEELIRLAEKLLLEAAALRREKEPEAPKAHPSETSSETPKRASAAKKDATTATPARRRAPTSATKKR